MTRAKPIESILEKRLPMAQIVRSFTDPYEECFSLRRRHLAFALQFLRDDPDTQIDLLVDLFALHRPSDQGSFEVCYLLRSTRFKHRLRISVNIAVEAASLPSVTRIFPNALWLECELYDLFGIFVEGHPHLRRLLLDSAFEGHPLQKTFAPKTL